MTSTALKANKVTFVGVGQVGMACTFAVLSQVRKKRSSERLRKGVTCATGMMKGSISLSLSLFFFLSLFSFPFLFPFSLSPFFRIFCSPLLDPFNLINSPSWRFFKEDAAPLISSSLSHADMRHMSRSMPCGWGTCATSSASTPLRCTMEIVFAPARQSFFPLSSLFPFTTLSLSFFFPFTYTHTHSLSLSFFLFLFVLPIYLYLCKGARPQSSSRWRRRTCTGPC